MKPTIKYGNKILATSAAAALLFATGCAADNGTSSTPETTEQQTVTEESTPTVTETATETAETTETAADSGETSSDGDGQTDFPKGEPVSTSNGAFTITPVEGWTAELKKEGEPVHEGYDPVETIELSNGSSIEGAIETGVVTDLDGPPAESEDQNSWRLENLDTPGSENETYLVEQLVLNEQEDKWQWMLRIVSKSPDDASEYEARAYRTDRQPNATFIHIVGTDGSRTGEASKDDAKGYLNSKGRDEAVEMLKGFEAKPAGD